MKQYTVFRRPKNEDAGYSIPENNRLYDSFGEALEVMNKVRVSKRMYPIYRPAREQPLLVELPDEWMELWIVDRPNPETDANILRNDGPAGTDLRKAWGDRVDRTMRGLDNNY